MIQFESIRKQFMITKTVCNILKLLNFLLLKRYITRFLQKYIINSLKVTCVQIYMKTTHMQIDLQIFIVI